MSNFTYPTGPVPEIYGKKPVVDDSTEIVRAKLPMFADRKKSEYLTLRACNFSYLEACGMLGLEVGTVEKWRKMDSTFLEWESSKIGELQSDLGQTIIQGMFLRCMFLTTKADATALEKQVMDPKGMTKEERDWAVDAAKRYKASDFKILLDALQQDGKGAGPGPESVGNVTFNIMVDGRAVEDDNATRAGYRDVIRQFTRNRTTVIDSESMEVVEE